MICYTQEEKKEPELDFTLEVDGSNGRKAIDTLVQNILEGEVLPPDIDPTDLPQALDGKILNFIIPFSDDHLEKGQKLVYGDLTVEILETDYCPRRTFYTIQFHYGE